MRKVRFFMFKKSFLNNVIFSFAIIIVGGEYRAFSVNYSDYMNDQPFAHPVQPGTTPEQTARARMMREQAANRELALRGVVFQQHSPMMLLAEANARSEIQPDPHILAEAQRIAILRNQLGQSGTVPIPMNPNPKTVNRRKECRLPGSLHHLPSLMVLGAFSSVLPRQQDPDHR